MKLEDKFRKYNAEVNHRTLDWCVHFQSSLKAIRLPYSLHDYLLQSVKLFYSSKWLNNSLYSILELAHGNIKYLKGWANIRIRIKTPCQLVMEWIKQEISKPFNRSMADLQKKPCDIHP